MIRFPPLVYVSCFLVDLAVLLSLLLLLASIASGHFLDGGTLRDGCLELRWSLYPQFDRYRSHFNYDLTVPAAILATCLLLGEILHSIVVTNLLATLGTTAV